MLLRLVGFVLLAACAPATAPPAKPVVVAHEAVAPVAIDVPAIRVQVVPGNRAMIDDLGEPSLEPLLPYDGAKLSTDPGDARRLAALAAVRVARRAELVAGDRARRARQKTLRDRIAAAGDAFGARSPEVAAAVRARDAQSDRDALVRAKQTAAVGVATDAVLAAAQTLAPHLSRDGILLRALLSAIRAGDVHDELVDAMQAREPDNADVPPIDYHATSAILAQAELAKLGSARASVIATLRGLVAIQTAADDAVRDTAARELVALARDQASVREVAARIAARRLFDRAGDRALVVEALQLAADTTRDPHVRGGMLYQLGFLTSSEPSGRAIDALCGAVAADADYRSLTLSELAVAIASTTALDPVVRACDAQTCPCEAAPLAEAGEILAELDRADDARRLLGLAIARFPVAESSTGAACRLVELARTDEALGDVPPEASAALAARFAAAYGTLWRCPVKSAPPPATPRERAAAQVPIGALRDCFRAHPLADDATLATRLLVDARGAAIGRPATLQSTLRAPAAACVDDVLVRHRWRGLGPAAETQLSLQLAFVYR